MVGREMVKRIWSRDSKLWHSGKQHRKDIANRLGWLSVASDMREKVDDLVWFTREIVGAGFKHAFLLGMGGSSLAPEVLRRVFDGVDSGSGSLDLTVLDTTDPVAIRAAEERVDISRTLFIVSSKSGGTVEVDSLFRYFYERTGKKGSQFIAITDPGTALATLARDKEFRRVFVNPPDIGGRYSVLSFFGLVPAALVGVDAGRLLDSALSMMRVCGVDSTRRAAAAPIERNPGFQLGEVLGNAALAGRDKVTLVMDPELESMGLWIEQLLAESTGKEGKGLIPVAGEVLGSPDAYGADRVFVSVRLTDAADATASRLDELAAAGHPVIRLKLNDRYDLGGEFFRWEFATAVAGAILGIDPFDQPNVQEAKDRTRQLLDRFVETGELAGDSPIVGVHNLAVQLRGYGFELP